MTESWKERKEHIKKCGGRPVNEPPSHAKPSREYLEKKIIINITIGCYIVCPAGIGVITDIIRMLLTKLNFC